MSTSRIFVRGLPPSFSEDDFRKHFSSQQTITDARLIPRRRIGYVGYKTPEDAAKAVNYFNKSFIRLSRIFVELARPITDGPTTQATTPRKGHPAARDADSGSKESSGTHASDVQNGALKRKRLDDNIAQDPLLEEYLSLMNTSSRSKAWANEGLQSGSNAASARPSEEAKCNTLQPGTISEKKEPPLPQNKPPKRGSNEQSSAKENVERTDQSLTLAPQKPATDISDTKPADDDHATKQERVGAAVSDRDWLRSKTSRLLGLIDDDEDLTPAATSVQHAEEKTEQNPAADHGDNHSTHGAETETKPVDIGGSDETQSNESRRLFVRNLAYTATAEDIRQCFSSYGELTEVHLPTTADGASKGFAYVSYLDAQAANQACASLDGAIFQGRLLHILPAAAKIEKKLDEFALSQLPLKKQREIRRRAEASSSAFNWNSLYMSADAVMSSIADRLRVYKADLLDPTSSDAAIKQAHAETHVIQETQQYFASNGVDLDAFQRKERGDTALLVKNFPYGTQASELKAMFEEFGRLSRLLMPPAGTVAIVEFSQPSQARAAFSRLAYRRFKDTVLFLEKAPKGLFKDAGVDVAVNTIAEPVTPKPAAADVLPNVEDEDFANTSTLYVRNLSFSTTSSRLRDVCSPLDGFLSAKIKTKPDPKRPGETLSMGFGFLEFRTAAQAQKAARALENYDLDGHRLVVRAARRDLDAAEETRKADQLKKLAAKRTKIVIKNLPFEATKKDVRSLFGTYGQLRSVRVPKKFNNSTRGFAFADFVTAKEAENAINALKHTHLLGRRLVLEFADDDPLDAEEEIRKMQEKVGRQRDKVAVQRLMGSKRQKFNVQTGDDGPSE